MLSLNLRPLRGSLGNLVIDMLLVAVCETDCPWWNIHLCLLVPRVLVHAFIVSDPYSATLSSWLRQWWNNEPLTESVHLQLRTKCFSSGSQLVKTSLHSDTRSPAAPPSLVSHLYQLLTCCRGMPSKLAVFNTHQHTQTLCRLLQNRGSELHGGPQVSWLQCLLGSQQTYIILLINPQLVK